MKPEISVVIPSYNSMTYIGDCLKSLELQDIEQDYEVIVVDSSTDNTAEYIKRNHPDVILVQLDYQTFPGKGRNIGAERATAKRLIFLDSDCVAESNLLRIVYEKLDNESILGAAVQNANPESLISKADFFLTFNEFSKGMPAKKVEFMPSYCLSLTKDLFDKTGGFPEDWATSEDMLFCLKIKEICQILFTQELLVGHNNRIEMKPFIRHHFNFGLNAAYARQKYDLSGKILARFPLMWLLALPARVFAICRRLIKFKPKALFYFLLPHTYIGLISWSLGFIKGATKTR